MQYNRVAHKNKLVVAVRFSTFGCPYVIGQPVCTRV